MLPKRIQHKSVSLVIQVSFEDKDSTVNLSDRLKQLPVNEIYKTFGLFKPNKWENIVCSNAPINLLVARAQSIHSCNKKFCAKSEAKRSTYTFWGWIYRHAKQFQFNVCFKDKSLAEKHDKVNIIGHKLACKLLLNK